MKFNKEEKEILIDAVKHMQESHEIVRIDFGHNERIRNRANEMIKKLVELLEKLEKIDKL